MSEPRRVCTGSRLSVLMIGPRNTHQGGITRAIDAWIAAGLTEHVDVDVVTMAAWDAPLPVQLFQSGLGLLKLAARLARPSRRPDVVHVHTSSGGSLYRKFVASWLVRRAGIPLLVHLHSGGFEEWIASRGIHRATAQRLVRLAAGVVVIAEVWRGLGETLGARRVYVVPHLLDPRLAQALTGVAEARERKAPTNPQVTILYYGRWAPIKGLDVLASALRKLAPQQQRRLVMHIFGNGDFDWVRHCFQDAGLVHIAIGGWLSDDQKRVELSVADAVVLPSRSEGFGASLLEAMATGTPIIASDAGAIPEVLEGYPFARLTRRGDPEDLRDALGALLAGAWPDSRTPAPSLPERYSPPRVIAGLVEAYRVTIRDANEQPRSASEWAAS